MYGPDASSPQHHPLENGSVIIALHSKLTYFESYLNIMNFLNIIIIPDL